MKEAKKDYYPKVTIITVVYNDGINIENTIKSVINQTYPNIEYIVIDGGSDDNTVNIIREYENSISYWISESDEGIYDAMNKGIKIATGEWILFRNSGDYFSSIKDVENVFNGTDYTQYDIIAGDALLWDIYGCRISKPEFVEKQREEIMPVWHPSTFVKASIYKDIQFDTRYRLAADHNFFYICKMKGFKFLYVPKLLSIFNVGDGASIKNMHISVKEHYYIHGGLDSDWIGLLRLSVSLFRLKTILTIKSILPFRLLKWQRRKKYDCLWDKNYTYKMMIDNALST